MQARQQVRIIGGEWRSRTLDFPDRPGLRPTPDRVRETLFNWLASSLEGSRVLDLCAGSGALGLEALSRGADEAILLDSDPEVVSALRSSIEKLGAKAQARVFDARKYLVGIPGKDARFDVVFVDPPYDSGLQGTLCSLLDLNGWLRPGARVYVETREGTTRYDPPDRWRLLREKRAGQVEYRLFRTV